MKQEELKKDKSLIYKLITFILVIMYFIYYIYQYITKDFDLNNKINFIRTIILFLSIFLLGCTSITKKRTSIVFSIITYIVLSILIIPNIYSLIPKIEKKEKKSTNEKIKITCEGSTDTSDNTIINIDYTNDTINKVVYSYTYKLENKTGAENLVNRFDKMYAYVSNIYSEIEISDKVIVTFTYKFDDVNIDKIKEIDDSITTSYKEFKNNNLNNLTCKNRE